MDTSAGISLGPSATILCVLNGGNPRVAARARGYRDITGHLAEPEPEPHKRGGLAGLFGKLAGGRRPQEACNSPFPFARACDLLGELLSVTPSDVPRRVCIAVPAWANDVQRQQVATGARDAGWELIALCNEPTAAAMASGLLRDGDGIALVYDLSFDRFEVSVVAIRGTGFEIFAADGIANQNAHLSLPQRLCETEAPCKRALTHAGLDASNIDHLVLVGEATRNEQTSAFVQGLFGMEPFSRFDPEEVTAIGTAVHASILEARKAQG
ncbi:MAG: hypothetical protein AMXMBFR84_33080 [Candidatus Hydrogenedentota bacterium]